MNLRGHNAGLTPSISIFQPVFHSFYKIFIEHLLYARHCAGFIPKKAQKRCHPSCALKDEYVLNAVHFRVVVAVT